MTNLYKNLIQPNVNYDFNVYQSIIINLCWQAFEESKYFKSNNFKWYFNNVADLHLLTKDCLKIDVNPLTYSEFIQDSKLIIDNEYHN
jgi:hypothetical protein